MRWGHKTRVLSLAEDVENSDIEVISGNIEISGNNDREVQSLNENRNDSKVLPEDIYRLSTDTTSHIKRFFVK